MPNTPPDEDAARCQNCGATLYGAYCHRCGQRQRERSIRAIATALFREITEADGRLWRTIRLLFGKPGLLTALNVHGRRARYVRPVRLYLLASVLFFGAFQYTQPVRHAYVQEKTDGSPSEVTRTPSRESGGRSADEGLSGPAPDSTAMSEAGSPGVTFSERIRRGFRMQSRTPGRFSVVFAQVFSTGLLLALPLIALALYLLYRLPLYDHVVFAFHFGAAFLIGLLAFMMLGVAMKAVLLGYPAWLERMPNLNLFLYVAFSGLCLAYLYAALQRTYRESRGRTVWKTAVVAVASLITFLVVQFASVVVTAYRVGGMS